MITVPQKTPYVTRWKHDQVAVYWIRLTKALIDQADEALRNRWKLRVARVARSSSQEGSRTSTWRTISVAVAMALSQAASLLAQNKVPEEVMDAIRCGRLTALRKSDGSVRGHRRGWRFHEGCCHPLIAPTNLMIMTPRRSITIPVRENLMQK